ncbi:MAG: NnrS family protein [Gammaproteobacteria bacterium]
MNPPPRPLLSYAFRPFFLLAGSFAVLGMLQWALVIRGLPWPAAGNFSTVWHAHEMVVGFAGATIAGFLLTAVATWTGRPPLRGWPLAGLALAWTFGRAGMLLAGTWPAANVAAADLLFPVLLAVLVTREVVAARNRRNYGIAALAWVFALLTAAFHAAANGLLSENADAETGRVVVNLMLQLLVLLITVVGGRVVPSFTGNWLRGHGATVLPVTRPWLEVVVVPLTAAAGIAWSLVPESAVTASLCTVAGLAHAVRLAGWRGLATFREPLVLVLHGAYAFLAGGFLLLGAVGFGLPLPVSAAVHGLAVGAVGGMILAMMTRVALGHTGRPLTAAPVTVVAYVLLGLAAVARVLGPVVPSAGALAYDLPAALWILAFTLFLGRYWPILK